MYFYNLMKELSANQEIDLYVDMDGVIAEYGIGNNPYDYLHKRPLTTNIKTLTELKDLSNITLHILSVCREDSQIDDKNVWLDMFAPIFKPENRVIISRASNDWATAKELKYNFLSNLKSDKKIMLVDDDNSILREIHSNLEHIKVMQDSELID